MNLNLFDVYGLVPTEYVSRSGMVGFRKTSRGWIVGLRGCGLEHEDLFGPLETLPLALAAYDAWVQRPSPAAEVSF